MRPGKRRKEDDENVHKPQEFPKSCTYPYPELWAELPGASAVVARGRHQHAADAVQEGSHVAEDTDADLAELPSDAEATLILLRNQLYPDPASAAAAAAAAKRTPHAKRSRAASGPSKVAAAAAAAAAATAAAARQLPPIILKSQLYTVLADRTAVDRDIEDLRRNGRLRLFKLAHGADEYVTMLTTDYLSVINKLVASHAQQQHQQTEEHPQQILQHTPQGQHAGLRAAGPSSMQQTPNSNSGSTNNAVATTMLIFRDRVLPACNDWHISRTELLQLLRSLTVSAGSVPAGAAPASTTRITSSSTASTVPPSDDDMQRHLLSMELICRDSRAADGYVFTVPGAAAFVQSVVSGRKELLQLLQRKRYQECLEKELLCFKLRNSLLTPAFHIRDLQGRGIVSCLDTTAGRLVRLVKRK